jgi:stromal membrane-associated protein
VKITKQPLSIVQEKAKVDRFTSGTQRPDTTTTPSQRRPTPTIDLFGDSVVEPPTKEDPTAAISRSADAKNSRQAKQGDSLLGLDFFGDGPVTGPARTSSASSNHLGSTASSRPDLKQSILSLYSSASKAQAQPTHARQPSSGTVSTQATQPQDAFGGLGDAFSTLSFSSPKATPDTHQPKSSLSRTNDFAPSVPTKSTPSAPQISSPPPMSGGGFFDSLASKKSESHMPQRSQSQKPSGNLDFAFVQRSTTNTKPTAVMSQDLFPGDDFSGFASADLPPAPPPTKVSSPAPPSASSNLDSVFNLSAPSAAPVKKNSVPKPTPIISQSASAMFDPWSSVYDSSEWEAQESTSPNNKPNAPNVDIGKAPAHITPNDLSREWGGTRPAAQKSPQAPSITADEDYGGWTSAPANQSPVGPPKKANGGMGVGSDPFDNPWG